MERLKIISSDLSVTFEAQLNSFLEKLDSDGVGYSINFQNDSECRHCAYVLYDVIPPKKDISFVRSGHCRSNCRFFEDRDTEGYCRYKDERIHPYRVLCAEAFDLDGAIYNLDADGRRG